MEDLEEVEQSEEEVLKLSKDVSEFIEDRFGKSEQRPAADEFGTFLNDKFPTVGNIKTELTVPERFAQLKKTRR
ncbi:MAG: hypothetical protein WCS03_09455 [Bacteroidota bacterium]